MARLCPERAPQVRDPSERAPSVGSKRAPHMGQFSRNGRCLTPRCARLARPRPLRRHPWGTSNLKCSRHLLLGVQAVVDDDTTRKRICGHMVRAVHPKRSAVGPQPLADHVHAKCSGHDGAFAAAAFELQNTGAKVHRAGGATGAARRTAPGYAGMAARFKRTEAAMACGLQQNTMPDACIAARMPYLHRARSYDSQGRSTEGPGDLANSEVACTATPAPRTVQCQTRLATGQSQPCRRALGVFDDSSLEFA